MGVSGELRFEGGLVGQPVSLGTVCVGDKVWRSPDSVLVIAAQGAGTRGAACWHLLADAGLAVVADCTLYGREHVVSALGLEHWSGNDAELLAYAYLRWGDGMLSRLDGDFAFVVGDWRNRKMFAATDPMGMRPLFYRHVAGERFAFSTSPESLAVWCGLDPRIPESRLLEPLLSMEELAHLRPEIPGISRLPAAHACHVDDIGVRLRRYWTPSCNRPDLRESDTAGWVEGVRWRMAEAVRKRMVDDARYAFTLSGGLDSSSVLALACRLRPIDGITAYSALDRGNPGCPETLAIDSMLAATGAPSVQADVANPESYAADALIAMAGTPRFILGRQGFLPLFDALAATSGATVMMNGLDADALFHGQDLLEHWIHRGQYRLAVRDARKEDRLLGVASQVPHVRKTLVKAMIPSGVLDVLRGVRSRLARNRHANLLDMDAVLWTHLSCQQHEQRRLLHQPHRMRDLPISSMDSLTVLDSVGRYQARSRGFGVEMRCPFLDRDLIEFSAWIPLQLRQRNGRHKWILRKAMNPYLPHAVTWRGDKYHLACHFSRSVFQPVLDRIVRDFKGSGPAIAPYVDRDLFLREVPSWQAGSLDAIWKLNSLLLLEHWLQHNRDKVLFGQ